MEISQAAGLATRAVATRLRAGVGYDDLVRGTGNDLGSWTAHALNSYPSGRTALRSLAQFPDGHGQAAAVTTQPTTRAKTDPGFADELVRKAAPRPAGTTQNASATDGGMAMNVGDGGSVRAKSITGRDNITNKKVSHGGLYMVLAVVAIVIVIALVKVVPVVVNKVETLAKGNSITADSTCQQFLDVDEATEQQALVDIAMSKGIAGFGSPLALPEIRYECSSTPNMKIGDVVTRDAHEF